MIRVPTYAPNQVRARQIADGRLNVHATPDAFGAAVGEGVRAVGSVMGQIAREEKAKADSAALSAAKNTHDAAIVAAQAEAQKTKGKDALGLPAVILPKLAKSADDIEKGLSSDDLKAAFRAYRDARHNDVTASLNGYGMREFEAYDKQQHAAGAQLTQQRIGQAYDDEGQVNNAIFDRVGEIDAFAKRNGLPEEWAAATQASEVSAAHLTVIQSFVGSDRSTSASAWFKKHGDTMTPDDRRAAERLVKVSGLHSQAAALADQANLLGETAESGRANITKAAGDNIALRDLAIDRFENHLAAQRAAKADGEHGAFAKAFKILEDPATDYAKLPADLLAQLDDRPDLKSQLMAFSKRQDRTIGADEGAKEAVRLTMLAYQTPEAFKREDPTLLIGKLPKAEVVRFTEAIMEAREGKPGKQLKSIITVEQAIADARTSAGIDEKKDPEDAAFFRQLMSEELLAAGISADDKDAPQQIRAIAARLNLRVAMNPEANGARPDTVAWRRAFDLFGKMPEDERTALKAEFGGSITLAVRALDRRLRNQAKESAKNEAYKRSPEGISEAQRRSGRAIAASGGIDFSFLNEGE